MNNCPPDCKDRTMCPDAGKAGHLQCGSCPEHNQPRHHCGCIIFTPEVKR